MKLRQYPSSREGWFLYYARLFNVLGHSDSCSQLALWYMLLGLQDEEAWCAQAIED